MDKGTIVRTIALAITWINAILANHGLEPIPVVGEETIAMILAGAASVWAWFKNNYITLKGRQQKEVIEQKGLN